jgi:transcription initiation factor IIE alpha subunit
MIVLDRKAIAAHVLRHLAAAQARGRLVRLDELACDVGVRKTDVREIISHLDAEGHVDGKRLRLTMTGLILSASMQGATLRPVRHVPAVGAQAKVA